MKIKKWHRRSKQWKRSRTYRMSRHSKMATLWSQTLKRRFLHSSKTWITGTRCSRSREKRRGDLESLEGISVLPKTLRRPSLIWLTRGRSKTYSSLSERTILMRTSTRKELMLFSGSENFQGFKSTKGHMFLRDLAFAIWSLFFRQSATSFKFSYMQQKMQIRKSKRI